DFDPRQQAADASALAPVAKAWRAVVSRLLLLTRDRRQADWQPEADWFGVGHGEPVPASFASTHPPRALSLAPAARARWAELLERHKRHKDEPWYESAFNPSWKKFQSYLGRLALVLHLLRAACGEVGALQPPWRQQNLQDPVPPGWVLLRPIL